MEQIYTKIWDLAKPYYQKGRVFDVPHVEWMMYTAHKIGDELKLDKALLLPIVILHDVGYSKLNIANPHIKDTNSKIQHMHEGAKIAEEILTKVNYDKYLKEKIVRYVSLHDNWILGDDSPFKECIEMAIFNDLDFLSTLSDFKMFTLLGESVGKNPREFYVWWEQDEKLTRRPFCCTITKNLFDNFMAERKRDIDKMVTAGN